MKKVQPKLVPSKGKRPQGVTVEKRSGLARFLAGELLSHADELDGNRATPERRQVIVDELDHLFEAYRRIRRGTAKLSMLAGSADTHLRNDFVSAIVARRNAPSNVARSGILAGEVIIECGMREPERLERLLAAKAEIERAIAAPENKGGRPRARSAKKTAMKLDWPDHEPAQSRAARGEAPRPSVAELIQAAGKKAGYLMPDASKDVLGAAKRRKQPAKKK